MRMLRRPLAAAVSLCLLLTAAGCFSGQEWAVDGGAQVLPGMTMGEVEGRLGQPFQIVRGEDGRDTEWIYRYESGPSTACIVFMVIFFVVLIVAVVASRSKGGAVGGGVFFGIGADAGPPYNLRLHFDSTGRLLEISRPYVAP
jgi:hypothetical protein